MFLDKVDLHKKQNILVIGYGLVGRRVCDLLLDKGMLVTAFDLHMNEPDNRLTNTIVGDLTDPNQVSEACRNMHVVIHTASPPHGKPRDVYFKVNVEGTRNVINACVERKVKKLVYTSSLSVVYYGQNLVNVDETEPYCTTHMDPYNETKQMAEIAVLKANGNGGLLTCAIRPTGIFGPRDGQASFELMKAAKDGHWRLQVGENNHLYDWTYVDNVAHIHVLAALKMEKDNGIAGEAFFVTNDQPIQFWDFSKYLYNGLGYRQTQYIYLPMFLAFIIADIMDFLHSLFNIPMPLSRFKLLMIHCNVYFNISKAKRLLGYQPIVTFQDGMDRTVEYWKTQGYGNQI